MSRLAASGRILWNPRNIRRLSNAFVSPPSSPPVKDHGIPSSPSEEEPPLNGRRIAIKDNICTTEYSTTCGSRTLETFTSPYDATVVTRLRAAGATIAGKTNLDEFGMGSHSTHSYFGPVTSTIKGVNDGVSAGGSSGGSALAVASGECDAALGTDTGGSVRLPAAYCGIVGFKPSYGLVSRWGVVAYAHSLDTVGVLANSSYEAQKIFGAIQTPRVVASCLAHYSLDAIEGYDARDPTSVSRKSRYRIADEVRARQKPRHLRIGVPVEYNIQELNPTIREGWFRALSKLQKQGHTVHQVSLPATKHALSAYYVLAPAEASSNLARYDGVRYGFREDANDRAGGALYAKTRGQGFGEEVKRRILLGAYSLSAEAIDNYFIQAQKVRRLVQQDFDRVFASPNPLLDTPATDKGGNEVDVLITPTAPTLPPTLEAVGNQTPLDAYMNDVFTVPASLAGLPAISLPIWMHFDKPVPELGYQYNEKEWSHPVGVQVIGQYGDDELVFDVATLLELNTEGFVLEVGRNRE